MDYIIKQRRSGLLLLIFVVLAGCSDKKKSGGDDDGDTETERLSVVRPPIALNSMDACDLDADCAAMYSCFQGQCVQECAVDGDCAGGACNDRGRCGGDGVAPVVLPNNKIVTRPEPVQQIESGTTVQYVNVGLEREAADNQLTYRIEDQIFPSDSPAKIFTARSLGDMTYELAIPVVNAGLASGASADSYNVVTAAGAFEISLVPSFSSAGAYAGYASDDAFSSAPLPVEFYIVTEPLGVALSDADAAWLVLDTDASQLFAPQVASGNFPTVGALLEYDAFVQRWVAKFSAPYEFDAASVLGWTSIPEIQIGRSLRFELEIVDDTTIVGAFSDHFVGMRDEMTTGDILAPVLVSHVATFEVKRSGPPLDQADFAIVEPSPVTAALLPLPSPDACEDAMLEISDIDVDGELLSCSTITTVDAFLDASTTAAEQASCARALIETALLAGTTADEIRAFLEPDYAGSESFAEFMEDCADHTNGRCEAAPELFCGRELAAIAQRNLSNTADELEPTIEAYARATQEAHLGSLLAAFYNDVETRKEWLKASDYPAVVAASVKNKIQELLDDWCSDVLDVQMTVLKGRFDHAGITVMANPIGSATTDAADAQRQQLLENTQAWRGVADSLTLAANRYDALLQDATVRREKAELLMAYTKDLYLISGLLTSLNRAGNAGANNALISSGITPLMRALAKLEQPFDRLIYAREAEVVLNRSVDPSEDADSVLGRLKDKAISEVDDANIAIADLLTDIEQKALEALTTTADLNAELLELRTDIVSLCGLPRDCDVDDWDSGVDGCQTRIEPGECGFGVNRNGSDWAVDATPPNQSEAGWALLDIQKAAQAVHTANEAMRAHERKAKLQAQTIDAFATNINKWNDERLTLDGDIALQLEAMADSQNDTLQQVAADLGNALDARQDAIDAARSNVAQWYRIELTDIAEDQRDMRKISSMRSKAGILRLAAAKVKERADAFAEAQPTSVGVSNDTTSAFRSAIKFAGLAASMALKYKAGQLEKDANAKEAAEKWEEQIEAAQMKNLEQNSELDSQQVQLQLDVAQADATIAAAKSQADATALNGLIASLQSQLETSQAYERDLQELSEKREDLKAMLVDLPVFESRIIEAEITLQQKLNAYYQIVQRAGLLSVRIQQLEIVQSDVNNLLGSPTAFFLMSNRLDRAEHQLNLAKGVLMDWLVGLEYYAVRPFMDLRIGILLANNTTQLVKIADAMTALQENCGGATNQQTVELSLTRDLLDISNDTTDAVTGETFDPAARLLALMENATVPLDRRIRYSADSTVGDLVSRNDVLAVSFALDANDFANLGSTCNAKVHGISLQIVGEFEDGILPTVSLLYDGTSKLRSCQPDIGGIVDTIGRDATAFSEITVFHAAGASASPVAGVNAFPGESSLNTTLQGYPLVSDYTLLIDPGKGGNKNVDWSALEDIKLQLVYTYQDFFTGESCQ